MTTSPTVGASSSRARIRAWRRLARTVRQGSEYYERWRCLPRLIRLDFSEIEDASRAVTLSIVARLEAAIARERRRLRTGHWAYDVNRHIALMQAWRAESRSLNTDAPQPDIAAALPRQKGWQGNQATAPVNCNSGSSANTEMATALVTGTNAS